jgi:hypothetical protein
MTAGTLAACLPIVAALLLARVLEHDWRRWGVALPVALGAMGGISSVVFWLLLVAPIASRARLVSIDAMAWTAVTLVLAWRAFARPTPARDSPSDTSGSASAGRRTRVGAWLAAMLALTLAALAAAHVAGSAGTLPHGEWDAWAMWNARARAIAIGYPSAWRPAVHAMPHANYPLLLPVFIARWWMELGRETVAVPMAVAITFGAATVLLAACSVGHRHGAARGWLTAAVLLASPAFLTAVTMQYADVPLAFYWLAALVACDQAIRSRRPLWWAAAGAALGLSAWTKNEGVAMFALAGLAMGVCALRSRAPGRATRAAWFASGALPAILAVASFRHLMPAPSYLFSHVAVADLVARARSLARWHTVAVAMGRETWFGGATTIGVLPIAAIIAVALGRPRRWPAAGVIGAVCVAGMLAVDAGVYLLLSPNLAWQLCTAIDRVIVQLAPAAVWTLLTLAGPSSSDASD